MKASIPEGAVGDLVTISTRGGPSPTTCLRTFDHSVAHSGVLSRALMALRRALSSYPASKASARVKKPLVSARQRKMSIPGG